MVFKVELHNINLLLRIVKLFFISLVRLCILRTAMRRCWTCVWLSLNRTLLILLRWVRSAGGGKMKTELFVGCLRI